MIVEFGKQWQLKYNKLSKHRIVRGKPFFMKPNGLHPIFLHIKGKIDCHVAGIDILEDW